MKTSKIKEKPEPIDSDKSNDESKDIPLLNDINSARSKKALVIPKQKAFKRYITQSECAFENSDIDNIIDQIEDSLKKTKP
jgi:hypothetical protein